MHSQHFDTKRMGLDYTPEEDSVICIHYNGDYGGEVIITQRPKEDSPMDETTEIKIPVEVLESFLGSKIQAAFISHVENFPL